MPHFPSAMGAPLYDKRHDLNADGVIDNTDALIMLSNFPGAC